MLKLEETIKYYKHNYIFIMFLFSTKGFPGSSDGKESACNTGDLGSILVSKRSPGEGNGYPLQYSCLENSMDREEPGGLQSMGSQKSLI